MVGPLLGRETDVIAESAYKIMRDYTARDIISGRLEKWSGQSRTSRTGGAASESFGSSLCESVPPLLR